MCQTILCALSTLHEFEQKEIASSCHWHMAVTLSYVAHNGWWRPSWQASSRRLSHHDSSPPHTHRVGTDVPPQRVITDVQVCSHPTPLLILGCSFVAALNFPHHLVLGFLGRGERSSSDCGAVRSTLSMGEGAGPPGETPPDPRPRRGGGRVLSQESAHGVRCST
jgi:hypothetical protein